MKSKFETYITKVASFTEKNLLKELEDICKKT